MIFSSSSGVNFHTIAMNYVLIFPKSIVSFHKNINTMFPKINVFRKFKTRNYSFSNFILKMGAISKQLVPLTK